MRVKYSESIEFKAITRINKMRSNIILRKDLDNLGSYRQISRALNSLILKKKLVKIGSGLYAKTEISEYSKIPLLKNGDITLREALTRLNIKFDAGTAEKEYNAGKSTQVPIKNIVKLKSRCRRKIGYKNNKLYYENNTNAK